MLAAELVSLIVRTSNGGVTRSEALEFINLAHRELLCRDTLFTKMLPEPTLQTASGQLSYTLPLGIRNVSRGYLPGVPVGTYNSGTWNIPTIQAPDERSYINFNCPIGQHPDQPLVITFHDDPGGMLVYLEAYWWPNDILAESDTLQLPPQHCTQVLRSRVMMLIEETNAGNSVYWAQLYAQQKNAWVAYSSQGNEVRTGALRPSRIYG